jgi:hypothetical protein
MKFRFPIVIIDEDYRSENTSGLGIRALAQAIEEEGFEVLGVTSYGDLSQFAQQQSRASAFILSIDDEEFQLGGDKDPIIHSLRDFIGEVRRKNEEVPIYIYGETKTSRHLPNDILRELHGFIHMFEDTPEFVAKHIIREAKSYLESVQPPFFKALLDYAEDGSYSWHCPGHSGGVAFLKSPVGQMYHQFYGENMLRADVCNAVEELGQLLDHNGAIGESERNAARIFNADHCFFVTNGTSTSNKIVWHHTVAPGDVVVVDRNCHKSILHSIIMTGAIPVFLKPTRNHFGIIGPIPQSEFSVESIQAKIAANPLLKGVDAKAVKPRVLTLTQSTYDGVLYNTETIKGMLDGYVDNLHFDEAWLPHAAFHPFYGSYHAMGKKRKRPKHSVVYATQSIHKLLAGISQASHVLVQDSRPRSWTTPVQRGVPDAHLDQPAVQHHRQLRRGCRHDGAARRHRAGGRVDCRGAGLPPRHAQGGGRVRRRRLVVQGLGPRSSGRGRRGPAEDWIIRGDGQDPQEERQATTGTALAIWPTASTCWTRSSPPSSRRPGPGRRVRQHRHSRVHRHQVPGRAWRGGREDGPVLLLHHVHHRHHQGPLEHHADRAAAVQGRLRPQPAAVAHPARVLPAAPPLRAHGPARPVPARARAVRQVRHRPPDDRDVPVGSQARDEAVGCLRAHRAAQDRARGDRPPGRPHHRGSGHAYPPGIPLLIPGEVFNKKIVDYLVFAREFAKECPGFETDIHGLVELEDENGEIRYYGLRGRGKRQACGSEEDCCGEEARCQEDGCGRPRPLPRHRAGQSRQKGGNKRQPSPSQSLR